MRFVLPFLAVDGHDLSAQNPKLREMHLLRIELQTPGSHLISVSTITSTFLASSRGLDLSRFSTLLEEDQTYCSWEQYV
jgi:hypothetical protein